MTRSLTGLNPGPPALEASTLLLGGTYMLNSHILLRFNTLNSGNKFGKKITILSMGGFALHIGVLVFAFLRVQV